MITRSFNPFGLFLVGTAWMCIFLLNVAVASDNVISIRTNPGFKHLIANLQSLVQAKAKENENHFFISKYPASREYTYMLWREGRSLWILELGDENPDYWRRVIQFPRNGIVIDLDKDVVPTEREVGSSTYLVDQSWVNSIVYDAILNGDLLVINRVTKKTEE
jgi:hypothetical protein